MNANTTTKGQSQAADLKARIARRAVQVFILVVVQAATLLLSSGRFDWVWAWVFIGLYLAGIGVNSVLMLRYNPETIAERARAGEDMKGWGKIVGGLFGVMYLVAMFLVAGLDRADRSGDPRCRCRRLCAGFRALDLGDGLERLLCVGCPHPERSGTRCL